MGYSGIDTRWLYVGLIALVAAERLVELWIAGRNARRLQARGGFEVGREHYPWMVGVHASLLLFAPLEVWLANRPLILSLAVPMLLLLACAMALRYWVIATLGDRWTTRVYVVPGEDPVVGGPYRWIRHPNYLAVVLGVSALPLVHTAWMTALFISLADAILLRIRIRVEEEALRRHSDYLRHLGDRNRFLPKALLFPDRSGHQDT